jgi:hypothetical protein
MDQQLSSPKVNGNLTRKVIMLHNQGYDCDFLITIDKRILCLQDNRSFSIGEIFIKIIDLCFDEISRSYKYIHTVETCYGDKGILIDSCICINAFLAHQFSLQSDAVKKDDNLELRTAV